MLKRTKCYLIGLWISIFLSSRYFMIHGINAKSLLAVTAIQVVYHALVLLYQNRKHR